MQFLIFVLEILVLFFLSIRVKRKIVRRLYKLTGNQKWTMVLYAILFLPGTFIHEISHFISALFLLVPVGTIDLTPSLDEERARLGSVAVAKTDPARRFLVGISPLVFGLVFILLLGIFLTGNVCLFSWCPSYLIRILISSYLIFQISNSMFMSRKDLEGAWVLFVFVILLGVVLFFLGVRISFESESFFVTKSLEVIKQINYLLLIPFGINFFLLTVAKIFRETTRRVV